MKYFKTITVVFLLVYLFLPSNVIADNYITVDNNNIMIAKGSSQSFTITLNNAAGRLDINTANSNIVSINKDKVFLDKSSEQITIEGINIGSTTINITATDVNTYDYQSLNNLKHEINVTIYLKGDINNNGTLNLEDITSILKKYLGAIPITDEEKIIADINNNGKLDLPDIIDLIKIYLDV